MIKYLLIFFSLNCFGGNWMSEADIALVVAGTPGYQVYNLEERCVAQESPPCFDMSGKDPEVYDVISGVLTLNTGRESAKAAAQAAAAADKTTREGKRPQRALDLKACVVTLEKTGPIATLPEIKDCLLVVLRHASERLLDTSELEP